MKATGIIRKVDELGRIVIPIELRKKFNIDIRDDLEIFVDGKSIILKKFEPNCIFCGNNKNLVEYNNTMICEKCLENIIKLKPEDEK